MDFLDRNRVGFETLQIESPDAGQPLVWYSPEDTRVLITSVVCRLTTSATVADRRLYVNCDQGHIGFGACGAPATQAASLGITYAFSFCTLGLDATADSGGMSAPLNPHLYLDPKDSLRITVANMDTTDQISGVHIRYAQALPR